MTFADHFSGHAADYARARPDYPAHLFAWAASLTADHDLAWDAGAGNGQASVALARHYARVVATEPSAAQVANAAPDPRIDYRVESAETPSLAAASVDLAFVAQALHWFDHARYFDACTRVLKPGGAFVAIAYGLLGVDPAVDRVIADFEHGVVGAHWPPERRHVDAGYRSIMMPYAPVAAPDFAMTRTWTLDELIAYLGTWSATQRYRAATGIDPLPALAERLAPAWGDATSARLVRWPLTVLAGRPRPR
jgi:SAM-dependent methyltransferase